MHGDGSVDDSDPLSAERRCSSRLWEVGNRVRITGGSPQLIGAVVDVGLPGRWSVRVAVDGRRGFGEVVRALGELELVDNGATGGEATT